MRVVIAVALLALGGCQSVQELRALAPQQSDYEICRAMIAGGSNPNMQRVAGEEAQRRQLNCAPYASAIVNQQAAGTALGVQMLQQSRPQYQPMPLPQPSVTCISRPIGSTVRTTCD